MVSYASLSEKRHDVVKRVNRVVAEQFGVEKSSFTRDSSLVNDLGADSLDVTELTMELEEEFSIDIPDDVADKLLTVGQIIDHVSDEEIDLTD